MAKKSKSKSKSRGKGKCGKGEVWRKGYTRASGTRVAGRCVKARGKSKSKSKSLGRKDKIQKRISGSWRKIFAKTNKHIKKIVDKQARDFKRAMKREMTREELADVRTQVRAEEFRKARAEYEQLIARISPDEARDRGILMVDGSSVAASQEQLNKLQAKLDKLLVRRVELERLLHIGAPVAPYRRVSPKSASSPNIQPPSYRSDMFGY